eukprot:GHVL01042236.1.p1 GENE.GHVL01042236.1~~GHVL01042236.1.p1  ORF type:complete len:347 (+),score=80.93 GHVL01042236.1:42-1082(+)
MLIYRYVRKFSTSNLGRFCPGINGDIYVNSEIAAAVGPFVTRILPKIQNDNDELVAVCNDKLSGTQIRYYTVISKTRAIIDENQVPCVFVQGYCVLDHRHSTFWSLQARLLCDIWADTYLNILPDKYTKNGCLYLCSHIDCPSYPETLETGNHILISQAFSLTFYTKYLYLKKIENNIRILNKREENEFRRNFISIEGIDNLSLDREDSKSYFAVLDGNDGYDAAIRVCIKKKYSIYCSAPYYKKFADLKKLIINIMKNENIYICRIIWDSKDILFKNITNDMLTNDNQITGKIRYCFRAVTGIPTNLYHQLEETVINKPMILPCKWSDGANISSKIGRIIHRLQM